MGHKFKFRLRKVGKKGHPHPRRYLSPTYMTSRNQSLYQAAPRYKVMEGRNILRSKQAKRSVCLKLKRVSLIILFCLKPA